MCIANFKTEIRMHVIIKIIKSNNYIILSFKYNEINNFRCIKIITDINLNISQHQSVMKLSYIINKQSTPFTTRRFNNKQTKLTITFLSLARFYTKITPIIRLL